MIEVNNLTLTYPSGKGVFNLDFFVKQGEVVGYLGPNGAGKTTTIRALLGFMPPSEGQCSIGGLNCLKDAPKIQKILGYIPGEISFLDDMNGDEFLKFLREMRGMKDSKRQDELLEMFELSPKGKIKKFSKGMKQKLGIVAAFMHNPEVLILDEPTSGLDPLMQNRFVELIENEKKLGKTILMSSHIFDEVERTCDNILIIKEGCIVKKSDVLSLKNSQRKGILLKPESMSLASEILMNEGFITTQANQDTLDIVVTGETIDRFIKTVSQFKVLNFDIKTQSLEDVFMQYYGKEGGAR